MSDSAIARVHAKLAPLLERGAGTDELVAVLLAMPVDELRAARAAIIKASVAEDGAEATAAAIEQIVNGLGATRH